MSSLEQYSPVIREAEYTLAAVAEVGGFHLQPKVISRAAARRTQKLLKGMEHFVRRLILMMALLLEHEIDVDMRPLPYPQKSARGPRRASLMKIRAQAARALDAN